MTHSTATHVSDVWLCCQTSDCVVRRLNTQDCNSLATQWHTGLQLTCNTVQTSDCVVRRLNTYIAVFSIQPLNKQTSVFCFLLYRCFICSDVWANKTLLFWCSPVCHDTVCLFRRWMNKHIGVFLCVTDVHDS